MTQGAHNATILRENPFWDYSLTVYQQDQCAEFLLEAQNRYAFDINVLLFIGWLAHQQQAFIHVTSFHSKIITFQQATVSKIRNLRIRAKCFNNPEFYDAIKSLELYAENIEQNRLYAIAKQMPASELDVKQLIENGVSVYLDQMNVAKSAIEEVNWLQTLIEYLQPEA